MTINAKSGGAIKDIVVSFKRNAVYGAMQGVYHKAGGVYGRVDAALLTLDYDFGTEELTITSTSAGAIKWVITTSDTAIAADVVSGTGATESGSILTFPGTIGETVDTSSLLPATDYWFHAVLTSDGTNPISPVATISITDEPVLWYETDALFAWDSIADTDPTQINPVVGGALALTHGPAAALTSGLWDFNSTRYAYASGMSATSNFGAPLLFAAVLEKGDQASAYFALCQFGAGAAFARINLDGANIRSDMYNATTRGVVAATLTSISQKKVIWGYFNGIDTLTAGVNQSESGSVVDAGLASGGITRDVRIGGTASGDSKANHGSVQYVSRSGMTLADAKAIVAKMQAHHGIAS